MTATAQILVREGPEATTTNAIAKRAGVSVGSLYQYFDSRDALVEALTRRHVEQMRGVLSRALDELITLPLDEGVREMMRALIAAHQLNPELDHALQRLAPTSSPGILDEFEELAATMVLAALRSRPELKIAEPELAAQLLVSAIGGVIRQTLRLRPEQIHEPALEQTLVELVLGYLDRQRALTRSR